MCLRFASPLTLPFHIRRSFLDIRILSLYSLSKPLAKLIERELAGRDRMLSGRSYIVKMVVGVYT